LRYHFVCQNCIQAQSEKIGFHYYNAMPYLIDGHNLIPKLPHGNLQSMDDEIELIQKLQTFCQRTGKKIEVYFDQAPAGQARSQRYGNVKAHFIRQGRTADAAMISRLRALGKDAQNWTIVTSDRQIASFARSVHAKVLTSDRFVSLMLSQASTEGSGPEESSDLQLSSEEVDRWMAIFGEDGDSA
jgi:predicted RNA-binding protein with PIN domain